MASFMYRRDIVKEAFVGTIAACLTINHIIKIPLFGLKGANVFTHWRVLILLAATMITGNLLGKKLVQRISTQSFGTVIKFVLSGLAIIVIATQVLKHIGLTSD